MIRTIRTGRLPALATPSQLTAFEAKAIDAAITVEPWAARFEEKGLAVRFRTPDQGKGLGPVQAAVIIYSGKFIAGRRPVAQHWMHAYLKDAGSFNARGGPRLGPGAARAASWPARRASGRRSVRRAGR